MIALIIAMEKEYLNIKENLKTNDKLVSNFPYKHFETTINGKKVDVFISGVGKINAAACTQFVCDKFLPHQIINAGVCGATENAYIKNPVAIATKVVNNDFDTSIVDGDSFVVPSICFDGEMEYPVFTQDHFVGKTSQDGYYEMEAYAVSEIAKRFGISLLVVKSVTDIIGKNQSKDYNCNMQTACQSLAKKLQQII